MSAAFTRLALRNCAAYDYNAQAWITGPEAVTLRRRQLREELALLEGPQGSDYFAFIRQKDDTATIDDARDSIREHLAELGRAA